MIKKKTINIEDIKEKISKNNIILFAIENCLTLINLLHKDEIIKILDKKIKNKHKLKSIYKMRIKLEENPENNNIDNIYDILKKNKVKEIEKIKNIEQEIYCEFITTNKFMIEAYNFAVEKNKHIHIINNTIYNNELIKRILDKLNISNYLDIINYNDTNEFDSKKTLYVIPKNDSFKIKENNKKRLNLYTYSYPTEEYMLDKTKYTIEESIMKAIQCNITECGIKFDYFTKFGIINISPIYYYFVNWLYENTKDLDNLYFLARDGYIPEKIYNKFKEKHKNNIYTKYIYASRKAYQIPGLILVDEKKAINTVTEWNMQLNETITVRDILSNCDLTCNDNILNKAKLHNINNIDEYINLNTLKNVKEFLKDIYSEIKNSLMKRYELAKAYLQTEGLEEYDVVNIMDIGWRGSVQNYIGKILNKKTYGYYFGTMITCYKDIKKSMKGCYSNKFMPINRSEFILDNIMMFELIFSAPYPALIGFEKVENDIKPVFSTKKNENANKIIDTFQKAAVDIIDEYLIYEEYLKKLDIKSSLRNYKKFLINKDYNDIINFRELKTNLGYGEKQKSYVLETTKKEILKNEKNILEESNFAFWKGAIYIEGIKSKEELEKFKKDNNIKLKRNRFTSNRIIRSIIVTTKNMKKNNKNKNSTQI